MARFAKALRIVAVAAALAVASHAAAAPKKKGARKSAAKAGSLVAPQVMIFDPLLPKAPPQVAYDEATLAKGFGPPVLFTGVKVKEGSQSGEGETVEVSEQTVTPAAPAKKPKKRK